jgi:diguanylate cyclase (GGDEF)-like protein
VQLVCHPSVGTKAALTREVTVLEHRPVVKSWLYPFVGGVLALGAPLGLILLRLVSSGRLSIRSAANDVSNDAPTYAYLLISTTIVFLLLGTLLGRRADRLEESSSMDPLTGLANRRHFDACLAAELKRARRQGSPLSLLLIDVDHLKEINDKGGHSGGDAALRTVADAIFASRRATDVAARWGGDEFMLLAPGTNAAGGLVMADRIREVLRRAPHGPGVSLPTVSIGVADAANDGLTPGALCAAADAALYEAKSAGRDRARVSVRAP